MRNYGYKRLTRKDLACITCHDRHVPPLSRLKVNSQSISVPIDDDSHEHADYIDSSVNQLSYNFVRHAFTVKQSVKIPLLGPLLKRCSSEPVPSPPLAR